MGKVTSGVFPVHANDFEVLTSEASASAPVWSKVAELEEVNMEVENNTETWNSFTEEGWQSALVTGKNVKITLSGKRCIGDAGNDYIASKLLANGPEAYVSARITMPDGTFLQWDKMACGVKNSGANGAATDVGGLEAELASHGKPKLTEAE